MPCEIKKSRARRNSSASMAMRCRLLYTGNFLTHARGPELYIKLSGREVYTCYLCLRSSPRRSVYQLQRQARKHHRSARRANGCCYILSRAAKADGFWRISMLWIEKPVNFAPPLERTMLFFRHPPTIHDHFTWPTVKKKRERDRESKRRL